LEGSCRRPGPLAIFDLQQRALAALHHGAGLIIDHPDRRQFEAEAYMNRGNAKQAAMIAIAVS
jgi:hypothetical protein